jgi:hypothetical protein
MRSMDYLIRAEHYAEILGHAAIFKSIYTSLRENFDIKYSVWLTLKQLYSDQLADQLQRQNESQI